MNKKIFFLTLFLIASGITTLIQLRTNYDSSDRIQSYINYSSSTENSAKILNEAQNILQDSSTSSKLIAIYTAQTVLKNDSDEYNNLWFQLQKDIVSNSEEIFRILTLKQENFKENPFFHQVYLNLISILQIDQRRKAIALAKSLEQKMEFNTRNEITEQNASIIVALILLKKNGYQIQDILPSINKGLAMNSYSPKAQEEFKTRIRTYINETNIQAVNF